MILNLMQCMPSTYWIGASIESLTATTMSTILQHDPGNKESTLMIPGLCFPEQLPPRMTPLLLCYRGDEQLPWRESGATGAIQRFIVNRGPISQSKRKPSPCASSKPSSSFFGTKTYCATEEQQLAYLPSSYKVSGWVVECSCSMLNGLGSSTAWS